MEFIIQIHYLFFHQELTSNTDQIIIKCQFLQNKIAKWSGFLMPFECWTANHLNTGQIDAILFSYVLVWYLNGWSST